MVGEGTGGCHVGVRLGACAAEARDAFQRFRPTMQAITVRQHGGATFWGTMVRSIGRDSQPSDWLRW